MDKESLAKEIRGALKSAIAAHGPVTIQNHASAAKRIAGAIWAALPGKHGARDARR